MRIMHVMRYLWFSVLFKGEKRAVMHARLGGEREERDMHDAYDWSSACTDSEKTPSRLSPKYRKFGRLDSFTD